MTIVADRLQLFANVTQIYSEMLIEITRWG